VIRVPHYVQLEQFEGPLDLLLRLTMREEVDITRVTLARVCEEYLANLQQVDERAPEEVADFLVVAAKLLYLKSLVILPTNEADEVIDDTTGLTQQLRRYRMFVEASHSVAAAYRSPRLSYAGQKRLIARPAFVPPPSLLPVHLERTMLRMIAALEPIVRIPRAIVTRRLSIDDRIVEIRRLVRNRISTSFNDLIRGSGSREERIVSFLAVLELMKQRVIRVEQQGRFAPMAISQNSIST
jgi:segregation and condensation protein A